SRSGESRLRIQSPSTRSATGAGFPERPDRFRWRTSRYGPLFQDVVSRMILRTPTTLTVPPSPVRASDQIATWNLLALTSYAARQARVVAVRFRQGAQPSGDLESPLEVLSRLLHVPLTPQEPA